MVTIDVNHETTDDDVVISGFSGKFPMSDNLEELGENLFSMADLVQPMEDIKWKNSKLNIPLRVGQISEKDKFDAGFFGIHRKQSSSLDIMTRLIMERSYEAIVDAGLNPSDLRHSNTTVLTSASISESENTWLYSDFHSGLEFLGHSRAMLANRISFWLNVNSSSYALTSMETGGIEAITIAYEGIKSGRFDAALIGSISLVLLPEISYHLKELNLLSADGKTKSFDAAADGFARSDGVAVMFLQRAKFAKRIYATVVHSAAEIFGDRKLPFITPMREPIINFLEQFYDSCGVDPSLLQFLEADGSGTKMRDQEELNAVDKALLCNRQTPLLIGSIKSNLGHANAASNFFSIAKILVAMQTGQIPPNIHYKCPSPNIPALLENRLKVVTEPTPWEGGYAAVSTLGLSGVYGHCLLKSYDHKISKINNDGIPRLVLISGRTQDGMEDILYKLESMSLDVEFVRLMHDVHASNITNHLFRGYAILPADDKPFHDIQHMDSSKRPIWFVFSGMGSQWPGMGRELLKLPVCAATLDKCHDILAEKGLDLKHIITTDDPSVFDTILHCFVGIAAIQLALVDALTLLGIVPDGVIGHSVGELGCAYADGCFNLEQMLLAAYYRGMASIEADLITGSMAAIGLGYDQVKDMVPPEVDVACHNSDQSSTLSGPVEPVKKFVSELKEKGIFARVVNVANIAYHSRYIKPAAPALMSSLEKLIPNPKLRTSRWVCSSVPEEKWDTPLAQYCSAEYHTNNLLSPVLFEEASRHIPKNAIAIEIAPHGLLQAILRRSLGPECTNIPLTQRAHPQGLHFLLAAIGKIYVTGPIPQVSKLYPPVQYPVSRGTPSVSSLVNWDHTDSWHVLDEVTLVDAISGETSVTVSLSNADDRIYAGHVINGRIIVPTFAYLKVVWETWALLQDTEYYKLPVMFEDVRILKTLEIPKQGALHLHLMIQRGSGEFEICQDRSLLATGKITEPENIRKEYISKLPALDLNNSIFLDQEEVYGELQQRGYQYKGLFQSIIEARLSTQGTFAIVKWSENWVSLGESLLQLIIHRVAEHDQSLHLPISVQKIIINPLEHVAKSQVLEAVYHHPLNVLRCGGMELQNTRTIPMILPPLSQPKFKLETVKFLQHTNPKFQNIQQFVDFSIQIAVENCYRPYANKNMTIIELTEERDTETLSTHLKAALPHNPQASLISVSGDGKQHIGAEEKSCCYLIVITNKDSLKESLTLLENGFLLVSMDMKDTWTYDSNLIIVTEQVFGTKKLTLLRKLYQPHEQKSTVLHPTGDTISWIDQIKKAKSSERLYVISEINSYGVGMLPAFVKQLVSDPELTHVRCMFTSDKNVLQSSFNKSIYQQQLCKDLITNVYLNGMWGGFHNISLEYSSKQKTPCPQLLFIQSIDDVKVEALGVSSKYTDPKEIEKSLKNIGLLEFSGKCANKRVMGLAQQSDNSFTVTKKESLCWEIPNNWSFENAASVPLAYSTAYYAMILTAKLQHGEIVLIHAGWSCIGQAAIALALDYECIIFTTVSNEEQKEFLRTKFPQLHDDHILSLDHFDVPFLIKTQGKGARIVLNTVSGPTLPATMRCLGRYGRFVQLARADVDNNTKFGMEIFLKSTAVFGVSPDNLFNMSAEWQKELHAGIKNGIERGIVQPLKCTVFSREQTQQVIRTLGNKHHVGKVVLKTSSEENTPIQNKFYCDPHCFYLIAGGKAEQCVHVAEWLVLHGARQLVVSLRSKTVSNQVTRRIGLLESYHKAKLVMVSTPAVTSVNSATSLLQLATSSIGVKLGAIFILPAEVTGQENGVTATTVSNLDIASRSINTLCNFVCLLSEGSWSTCEARHHSGLPALAIHWPDCQKENFNLRSSLQILDEVLTIEKRDPVVVVTEAKLDSDRKEGLSLSSLDPFLPSSLDDLATFGEDLRKCSSCNLVELPSLSPGMAFVKEVQPVFLIPGLQGAPEEVLKPLSRHLHYPAICVKLPYSFNCLSKTAASLVKKIQEIQPKGPYNLVGVSWGGVITLELARQLETQGAQTRVVLIDGALDTIRRLVELLNKGSKFQANLICRLLQINSTKIREELMQLSDWTSKLCCGLKQLSQELYQQEINLKTAITSVADRISAIQDYKNPSDLLSGVVTLIRPAGTAEDNCGLTQFFKQTVNIRMIEGDHRTILSNPETANIINNFIL